MPGRILNYIYTGEDLKRRFLYDYKNLFLIVLTFLNVFFKVQEENIFHNQHEKKTKQITYRCVYTIFFWIF